MRNNHVVLFGYVGKQPVTGTMPSGAVRTLLRVATHYKTKAKDGTLLHHTEWHNIVAWDKQATYAAGNFVVGSKIMIEGSLNYRQHSVEIKAHQLINLDR